MSTNHLNFRVAMHDAERHARTAEDGNPFTLAALEAHIATARAAYLETPEARVAQRLHVAIDRMEDCLPVEA